MHPRRLLSHSLIHAHLLRATALPLLLRSARASLFPNNMPGKSTLAAPESPTELAALRTRCAAALWALVPRPLGRLYFGTGRGAGSSVPEAESEKKGELADRSGASLDREDRRIIAEIETGIVDLFGDAYCNKHLVYSILELILVRLMPELAEKGVIELWEERIN